MKKIYLLLVATLSVFTLQAQKITLLYNDEEITSDQLEVSLNPEAKLNMTFIHVQNDSENDITFRAEMEPNMSEGNTVSMCFAGNCMVPTAMKSESVTVEPGEIYSQFDLQYEYTSLAESSVLLHFIEEGSNDTLKNLNVVYKSNNNIADITEEKSNVVSVKVIPNPANTVTTFNYSIPFGYEKAQLVIQNALGSVVEQTPIKVTGNGKVTMNVSGLAKGVYFYSIVADGKTLITKKLIVKH
ncbi:MAG: T9SS type A sorting domain-containing protein [Bacteroidales bacterium]|nr:T9SS type A sorting domain-containing protein [Bacteroidales bacterium]